VSDPSNQIFVVRNGGFVALALEGAYQILSVIDQTHLSTPVQDNITRATLGWTHEVTMSTVINSHGDRRSYVVALFLNLPMNNCAILQKGNELQLLMAGQHVIIDPNVTLRGIFTCGENQIEMPTKDIFTRDQVPVGLKIYLKWQLLEPLKLATHGYDSPYAALRDKAQSILTQIVAHLDYSSMVKQRSFGPDQIDDGEASSAFLDALRTRAMDDLMLAAQEYGIVLKDLAVIDRQFKGDIAATMDKLTTRALQAQVDAANVDRENSNRVKHEQGALQVEQVKAQSRKTQADAEAYTVVTTAKARAEARQIAAEAEAEATRLTARAEADAIRLRAEAEHSIPDSFAREMQRSRLEVNKVAAYGNRTLFVPTNFGGDGSTIGNAMALGMAAGIGANAAGNAGSRG
jgi:regulator of protease activity HflC (stomatin/prohibitin superfamily)